MAPWTQPSHCLHEHDLYHYCYSLIDCSTLPHLLPPAGEKGTITGLLPVNPIAGCLSRAVITSGANCILTTCLAEADSRKFHCHGQGTMSQPEVRPVWCKPLMTLCNSMQPVNFIAPRCRMCYVQYHVHKQPCHVLLQHSAAICVNAACACCGHVLPVYALEGPQKQLRYSLLTWDEFRACCILLNCCLGCAISKLQTV